jgi:hypothetical protein
MSFIESRSDISICNKALSRIGQAGLSGTLDDPANNAKLAGRECRLHYKPTVRWVLEQHHWNLATKRQTLVETSNARSLEWGFAYAKPADMAFPVAIYSPGDATSGTISYYRGLKGLMAQLYGKPLFTYSGGVLYSMLGPAEIEFTSLDITEQDFTEQLEDLIVLFLASKLAYSVAKDHRMGNEIKQEALTELNRVIAANLNEQQPTYGNTMSEAEMARNGLDPWVAGFGLGHLG